MERRFTGVFIPAEVWFDKNLSPLEKFLLGEITSLDIEEVGCTASNEHFAQHLDVHPNSIARMISKLKECGYIWQESFDGRTRVLKSRLNVSVKSELTLDTGITRASLDIYKNQDEKSNQTKSQPNQTESSKKKLFSESAKKRQKALTIAREYVNCFTNDHELQNLIMQYLEHVRKTTGNFTAERAKAIIDEIRKIVSKSDGFHSTEYAKKYMKILLGKGWKFPYQVAELPPPDYEEKKKAKAVRDMTPEERKAFEDDLADETF